MNLDALLPLTVVGVTTGSVYALAAMGLVLTFKTSGVFNFAHGAQAAVAAYLMHSLQQVGLPWPLAGAVAVAAAGVGGGLVLEQLARALGDKPPTARVVATIGLLIGIQAALVAIYGAPAIVFERFLPEHSITVAGVSVRASQLIVVGLAAGAAGGLYAFFTRSTTGIAMQAVVDDPDLVDLVGVEPRRVRRTSWILGSVFAAVSGILLAHELNLDAAILTLLVVQAFGAAALGAFDSLPRVYAGAIGIGVAVAVLPDLLGPLSGLAGQATLPFLVLFGALLLTPRRRLVERGVRLVRRPPEPGRVPADLRNLMIAAGLLTLIAIPLVVGTDVGLYSGALVAVILFASLFLLVRTSGQVSLCHLAFAGIGAAVAARAVAAGVPWLAAVALGGLAAVPAGAVVAYPAIRLSGIYLAIATFGYGLLLERLLFPSSWLFGDAASIASPRPALFGLATSSDTGYYYVVLVFAVASLALVVAVRRSRLGRLLSGLADSPTALAAHGLDTNLSRLYVFAISAFLAGIAGALTGPITGTASSLTFDFVGSLLLVAILVIAGRRLLVAPFVGAFLYAVAPNLVDDPTLVALFPVAFGITAVAVSVWPASSGSSGASGKPPAEPGGRRADLRARPVRRSGAPPRARTRERLTGSVR